MTLIISWTQHWDSWWGVGAQEEGEALSRSLNGTNCTEYGATSIMKGVKAHYIVHKMLSQSNFCKILKIVIDHVIKYNQLK